MAGNGRIMEVIMNTCSKNNVSILNIDIYVVSILHGIIRKLLLHVII